MLLLLLLQVHLIYFFLKIVFINIKKIKIIGKVKNFAGSSTLQGDANGFGSEARFNLPRGMAYDTTVNSLFVAGIIFN